MQMTYTGLHEDVNYLICETQGEIFEYAASKGYDMIEFSRAFMASHFCERAFDTPYSRFQVDDAEESWQFLYPEIKDTIDNHRLPDDAVFDGNVAHWIGFTYRQIFIETGVPSKDIAKKLPFEAMVASYPGLHTLDEEDATDRLCKSVGIWKIGKEPSWAKNSDNDSNKKGGFF